MSMGIIITLFSFLNLYSMYFFIFIQKKKKKKKKHEYLNYYIRKIKINQIIY